MAADNEILPKYKNDDSDFKLEYSSSALVSLFVKNEVLILVLYQE